MVATRPLTVNGLGLTPRQAEKEIEVVLNTYTLLPDLAEAFPLWRELCARYSVSGRTAHDTRLVAFMLAHRVTRLLTYNLSDFARYSEVFAFSPAQI